VFGAANSLAWDYAPGIPQKEEAEQRVRWDQKPIGGWFARRILGRQVDNPWPRLSILPEGDAISEKDVPLDATIRDADLPSNGPSNAALGGSIDKLRIGIVQRIWNAVREGVNVVTVTLVGSVIVALVKQLKALFVDVVDEGGPAWRGPDGKPPLAFMIDTGTSDTTGVRSCVC
jgi:hypothetical protein